jgi:hypothetical protein
MILTSHNAVSPSEAFFTYATTPPPPPQTARVYCNLRIDQFILCPWKEHYCSHNDVIIGGKQKGASVCVSVSLFTCKECLVSDGDPCVQTWRQTWRDFWSGAWSWNTKVVLTVSAKVKLSSLFKQACQWGRLTQNLSMLIEPVIYTIPSSQRAVFRERIHNCRIDYTHMVQN